MEGEENTPNAPEEMSVPEARHSEEELVFVLILVGLFGVAFLAWFVGSGVVKKETSAPVPMQEESAAQFSTVDVESSESQEFEALEGFELEQAIARVLAIADDEETGERFIHPKTAETLYINDGDECVADCLEDWIPYFAEESAALGQVFTIVRESDGLLQYAWRGFPLYTSALLDYDESHTENDTMWSIAKP